ncbi:hypothetical protein ACP275_06G044600 [Erythranthe tilingii]
MACNWSAENATNAYLKTMRMGKSGKEPNGAEFVSALAAGNNVQLTVVACGGAPDSTALALAAAAQQTGGRIICILRGAYDEMHYLGQNSANIEFVFGEAKDLLLSIYKESDFVAIDCNLENHEEIISALLQERESRRHDKDTIVLGYNAFCKESWRNIPFGTELLPIGEGLLLTRIAAAVVPKKKSKSSNWIVKVDKCTGEEHVFRVRSSVGRTIRA